MSCRVHQVNGITVLACDRGRAPIPCASCGAKLAQEICDGCDQGLCARCATSPREGLDFCPACARPLFVEWFNSPEGKRWASGAAALHLEPDAHRDLRRNAFRKWARENVEKFELLRTTQSQKHGRPATSPATVPLSVQMMRALSSSQRVEAELHVSRSGRPFVEVDHTRISASSPIGRQWEQEQNLEAQTTPSAKADG